MIKGEDMTRASISITPPNDEWIQSQIKSEEFSSRSEVVNDLIRKARQQDEELELLRTKLIHAEQGGVSHRTPEQIRKEAKSRLKKDG